MLDNKVAEFQPNETETAGSTYILLMTLETLKNLLLFCHENFKVNNFVSFWYFQ